MTRNMIINEIVGVLENNSCVHAAWLEGSDATGNLDEYSDIDICADIDAEAIDSVFSDIQRQFEIDSIYENSGDAERQLVFHIGNTDKYLMVDFNAYIHGIANTTFIRGDKIDACKILFDRGEIIQYKDYDPSEGADACAYWEKESRYRFSQISRVEKYCLREQYPEAYIYYNKYVIEPLVFTLRRKYTPTKISYYMVHISQHIPAEEVEKLNKILQISSTNDIMANLSLAKEWYRELEELDNISG